jgi:hypothetical protein
MPLPPMPPAVSLVGVVHSLGATVLGATDTSDMLELSLLRGGSEFFAPKVDGDPDLNAEKDCKDEWSVVPEIKVCREGLTG